MKKVIEQIRTASLDSWTEAKNEMMTNSSTRVNVVSFFMSKPGTNKYNTILTKADQNIFSKFIEWKQGN